MISCYAILLVVVILLCFFWCSRNRSNLLVNKPCIQLKLNEGCPEVCNKGQGCYAVDAQCGSNETCMDSASDNCSPGSGCYKDDAQCLDPNKCLDPTVERCPENSTCYPTAAQCVGNQQCFDMSTEHCLDNKICFDPKEERCFNSQVCMDSNDDNCPPGQTCMSPVVGTVAPTGEHCEDNKTCQAPPIPVAIVNPIDYHALGAFKDDITINSTKSATETWIIEKSNDKRLSPGFIFLKNIYTGRYLKGWPYVQLIDDSTNNRYTDKSLQWSLLHNDLGSRSRQILESVFILINRKNNEALSLNNSNNGLTFRSYNPQTKYDMKDSWILRYV